MTEVVLLNLLDAPQQRAVFSVQYAERVLISLEEELYEQVKRFAIGVRINAAPTHIAGLPCAVSIGCHSLRSATEVLA